MNRLLLLVLLAGGLAGEEPVWIPDSLRSVVPENETAHFRLVKVHNRWTSPTHLTVVVKTSAHYTWYDSVSHWHKPDTVDLMLQVSPWPDGPYRMYHQTGPRLMGVPGKGEYVTLSAGPFRTGEVYWYYVGARAWNPYREHVDSTERGAVLMGTSSRKDVEGWREDLRKRSTPAPGDQFQAPPVEAEPDSLLLLR